MLKIQDMVEKEKNKIKEKGKMLKRGKRWDELGVYVRKIFKKNVIGILWQ